MRNLPLSKNFIGYICVFCVITLAFCGLLTGCASSTVQNNRAYLEEMESQSVDDAQRLIYQRADEKRVPILEQSIVNDCIDTTSSCKVFENCVFIGDSVTYMGFLAGYLTEDEVSAYYSVSLKTCDEYVQAAIDMHPAYIIFNFGTNDMVLFGGDADAFAQKYLEECEWIKSELPYVQIYICSTLSPTAETMAENDGMVYADEFNEAVSAMCEKNDRINYCKTDDLVGLHTDLRADDGIHFQNGFYGYFFARCGQVMFL